MVTKKQKKNIAKLKRVQQSGSKKEKQQFIANETAEIMTKSKRQQSIDDAISKKRKTLIFKILTGIAIAIVAIATWVAT